MHRKFLYAYSDSLLLTPLCCDDIHDVTPRVSALARCDIDDSGNTGDEGKAVGGAIGACGSGIDDSLLVALYACMTFIYGSSWKGEMASEAKRSLVKSSEGLGEVFLGEARE
ncbi:hypothetical protein Tco_0124855 [Tanacetum coccineum]